MTKPPYPTGDAAMPRHLEPGADVDRLANPVANSQVRHIDSTNRYALDAARAGEAPGLVVIADHQRRRSRAGAAARGPRRPGPSLLVSVLLRPASETDRHHLVTLAAGARAPIAAVRRRRGCRRRS